MCNLAKVLLILITMCGADTAAPLVLPPASENAMQAARDFEARSAAVVNYAACELEDEYLRIRGRMSLGKYEQQGEDLTSILLAKLSYARARDTSCTVRVTGNIQMAGFPNCAQSIVSAGTQLSYSLTPTCMVQQVNEAIQSMAKEGLMGTNKTWCFIPPRIESTGDFDVNVRELVRILYYAGNVDGRRGLLQAKTVDHMYENLLVARGQPSAEDYSLILGCGNIANEEGGSPEDTADRRKFIGEVGDFLGDAAEWAISYWLVVFGVLVVVAAASTGGLLGIPLALAGTGLATGGGIGALPFADVRIGETENHRLMIESSRFLTNQAIIKHLSAKGLNTGGIEDDQKKVKTWLLERLARIAREDFQEYNSRPYTRYSLEALMNLHDFADGDVQVAAHNVLDLSAAKFSIFANHGRRIVPFRRLAESDGRPGTPEEYLFNISKGGDHEVLRAIVLTGQTQRLPKFLPSDPAPRLMVNTAISTYRLPAVVHALAFEPTPPFEQTVLHTALERVYRSSAYNISAGGTRSGATIEGPLGVGTRNTDRGVAMPTVLIPSSFGIFQHELIRFDGVGVGWERSENMCVRNNFACGLNPQWGTLLSSRPDCIRPGRVPGVSFISTAACGLPSPHFYAAMLSLPCDGRLCVAGRWGVLEALTPPLNPSTSIATDDPAFQRFIQTREVAMAEAIASVDAARTFTYITDSETRIRSRVSFPRAEIVELNGTPTSVPSTAGRLANGVVTGLHRLSDGHYRISEPKGVLSLEIDMRNAVALRRRQ